MVKCNNVQQNKKRQQQLTASALLSTCATMDHCCCGCCCKMCSGSKVTVNYLQTLRKFMPQKENYFVRAEALLKFGIIKMAMPQA